MLHERYMEKIYAGWLAKIIGIRMGAPIEGWTYDAIQKKYGELTGYPVDYQKLFAADDDSNGPLFYLRALEACKEGFHLTPQDVGNALLNYAPFEHGFFWWGGYGVSTEHTAYLNLRNGIPAPRSGSIAQNGKAVAEQIGGQIFIDTWGLVTPGNPDLAASFAKQAASVTHDGNGIYGGIFIACCISHAFDEENIHRIIEKGLSYIPADCEYTRVVRSVMAYYESNPQNWRDCFHYIFDHFGYDRYPGSCHIIPNAAVMILSLLYGEGDFSRTLNICNMCGWDTDCNVGNVATIMGVRGGLDAIDPLTWRQPVNDLLICSSVIGSLNIMDIPYGACYIAKLAWAVAGEALPQRWQQVTHTCLANNHFEFSGSTHAFCVRAKDAGYTITNTNEAAFTGARSLKLEVQPSHGDTVYLYKKTYYKPDEFHDSRYDPSFSPLLYPGQTIQGSLMRPENAAACSASLYVRNVETGDILKSDRVPLEKGVWTTLSFTIPTLSNALLDEAGFALETDGELVCYMDDFYFSGNPSYSLDFAKLPIETWFSWRKEISQFTRLKGLLYKESDQLHLSCCDFGEAYTGGHDWRDYTASFTLTPQLGTDHFVNVRVQGGIRSYAAGLFGTNKLGLFKNQNGYRLLMETDFAWTHGTPYKLTVTVCGATLMVQADDGTRLRYTDEQEPYATGGIGLSVQHGSHCSYGGVVVS